MLSGVAAIITIKTDINLNGLFNQNKREIITDDSKDGSNIKLQMKRANLLQKIKKISKPTLLSHPNLSTKTLM